MQQVNPKTGPEIASRTRQQLAKKTGPEIVDSRTRQQQGNDKQNPSSASAKQQQGSAKQQQVSSAKQQVSSAKQQVSSAKQQASSANQKRPSIASQQLPSSAKQNTSSAKQQPKEKRVADTADSRSNQNRMKRAMIEVDGNSGKGQGQTVKKTKRSPMCKSTSIEEFLKENGENSEEDECENLEEEENMMGEEENTQQNGSKQTEGASKKRTRGPTKCLKIHARKSADREEVVLDDDGEPIGPNDRTVTDLSCFLGTVARNSDLCPLVFTNFKALKKANKDRIWEFVTDKFIIPENGRRAVFSRINDAWRRFKKDLKKSCFLKYTTMSERLKHRPQTVPEVHFKQLISYWKNNNIQKISKINAVNRAKQKYMHRMGPTNFARIRAKLRAKKEDGKEVSQAEMFIETRQSRKGKQPDEETSSVISKLQESVQNSTESETFNSLFGKEKSGRVRCYGRTITPTMLKRKEEILVIKRQHNDEVAGMKREMDGMKALFKTMMKQQNPQMSDDEISNLMASAMGCSISSTAAPADPHSSASTHIPHCEQGGEEADCDEDMEEACDDHEDVEGGYAEDVEEGGCSEDVEEEQGEDQEE
ncbi:uncharacterized protein LOC131621771 [Vicia villosa]|uniref:uncharacterized protein LOC131621771 n=6 Tax=Vicia villosa TaxID=3911 RepID=UPI00273BB966|nr:uncharacterized protein LOC131621771 [Vicia villosa]